MTKVIFKANGKSFTSYAAARAESKYVDTEYIENWIDLEEKAKHAEAARKAREKRKELLEKKKK